MRTPFAIAAVFLAILVFASQNQPGEANCGNGVSTSNEAKCRKDNAPGLCKKNGNKGSSSDEDSDSGEGDSGSDSGSDDDGDGDSDSDSGNSGDAENDWDSLPDEEKVTAGSPATDTGSPATGSTGSPATAATLVTGGVTKRYRHNRYHCELIDSLRNISKVELDVEQGERLEKCIRKMEHFLSHAFGLSDAKKAGIAAHKLRQCLKKEKDICSKVCFKKIGTWGSVWDVTYVSIDLQADFVDVIISLDGSDDCDLFEALRNATQGDIEKESAVLVLIEELKLVLKDGSLTLAQKKAKCHDVFKVFFEIHVEWEEFFLEIEIEGFGPLGSFLEVTKGFKKSLTLEVVLSGSSDADCKLCAALTEAVANTSFSFSTRNQIKQLHDKYVNYCSGTVDIELRLIYLSQQYWQLIVMEPWIVEILSVITIKDDEGEEWGNFYEIIWSYQFCKNSGSCGCIPCGQNPATTPAPVTTPVPATTIPPAVCPNRPSLIVISAQNKTILTDVLTEHYNSWNSSQRFGFNTCFNLVRKAIWDHATFPTPAVKITEIVTRFKQYNPNNLEKQKVLMDIFIAKWNGKIGQFCDCGSG